MCEGGECGAVYGGGECRVCVRDLVEECVRLHVEESGGVSEGLVEESVGLHVEVWVRDLVEESVGLHVGSVHGEETWWRRVLGYIQVEVSGRCV